MSNFAPLLDAEFDHLALDADRTCMHCQRTFATAGEMHQHRREAHQARERRVEDALPKAHRR